MNDNTTDMAPTMESLPEFLKRVQEPKPGREETPEGENKEGNN